DRWGGEPGPPGRAQPQGRDALEPAGHLPVERAAEVTVVFEPRADVEQHALAHLTLDPAVHAEAGARPVHLIGRLEAREHLGPGLLRRAVRHGVEIDAGRGPAGAQLPGGLFARLDAVLLTTELAARDECQGAQAPPGPERPHDVEVADRLGEGQAAG